MVTRPAHRPDQPPENGGRPSLGRYHLSKVANAATSNCSPGQSSRPWIRAPSLRRKGPSATGISSRPTGPSPLFENTSGCPPNSASASTTRCLGFPTKSCFTSSPGSSVRAIWVFPHLTHTNIGICFNPDTFHGRPGENHPAAVHPGKGVSRDGARLKGGLINHLYCGFHFGDIFLAGDAAGLASRPSGEGIHFALASGREIGRKILDAGYDMKEFSALLSLKRRQDGYSQLFESVPRLRMSPGGLLQDDEEAVDAGPHGLLTTHTLVFLSPPGERIEVRGTDPLPLLPS